MSEKTNLTATEKATKLEAVDNLKRIILSSNNWSDSKVEKSYVTINFIENKTTWPTV